jgi:Fur family iron response transcriptional regulator
MSDVVMATVLLEHGIQPSAQRLAVAAFVLVTDTHPSADQVLAVVRSRDASVSRATVYNTLHTFVEHGLLRELTIAGTRVVFDPRMEPHHHFVDDDTGVVSDLPLSAFSVEQHTPLDGIEVREVEVVVRGRRR